MNASICSTGLSKCDAGWRYFRDACYKLINKKLGWQDAESYCRQREKAHLTDIHSAEENRFITAPLSKLITFWIGYTDGPEEGNWTWTTTRKGSYTNWALHKPAYWLDGYDCALTGQSGYWNDHFCSFQREFVCEKGMLVYTQTQD